MIIVKHPTKEKIYVYACEADYESSIFGREKRDLANFYFKWNNGRLVEVIMKCRNDSFHKKGEAILSCLNNYFLNYSDKQYLPVEFCTSLDRFLSNDFKPMLEIKTLLKFG